METGRQLIKTGDGSHTIGIPGKGITYHSTHGAIQESRHVFIEAGLLPLLSAHPSLAVLEVGFGTGLNALLTLQKAVNFNKQISYTAIEPYPLQQNEYTLLNYAGVLHDDSLQPLFLAMHQSQWNKVVDISPLFSLHKISAGIEEVVLKNTFDVIYYDAFAPNDQPEMWTEAVFRQMFGVLNPGGVLVTYCSKGAVRRALQAVGFMVSKLPGPPGKREIIKAIKPCK